MLKVISVSKISGLIAVKKEVIDLLGIGDEILYILDEKGIVNIRNFKNNIISGMGEYISSSDVIHAADRIKVTIPAMLEELLIQILEIRSYGY
jgi:hypothetical protein